MITGEFNHKGELVFEIGLIAADETDFPVQAIFDTGFNDWLLMSNEDAEDLGWRKQPESRKSRTAGGIVFFNIYEGIIVIDEEEFTIPVLAGSRVKDILLGVRWLQFKRLIADYSGGVLTLD
ncbi:aspartyl protease [Planktothricoides raciborskii]|uniref:Aspartyl protease n=1 Tax=Planktothricoides raciborskii FACHB-1370 TaxID=2949576 RepID=A0ABR8EKV8_9CYAN|nr:aspartyl protease [Planktothricoides raciborskii]MBD2546212.1 aspartyl protease [Planktothricoides raciborskii FACHB-1370]MBD2584485.1 aspartyl protease [Planktothricoides raciborskii FACHB-1261]